MSVTINVEIDGISHPISACSWYFISPCGCTHGVMTTKDYETGGWITTPAQAMAEMTPNKAVREQDIARGETVEIGLSASIHDRLGDNCPHTPKWGRVQIPEGTEWGRASGGRVAHIVDALTDDDDTKFYRHKRAPKCGAKDDWFEIHPAALHDAPMCKKCIKIGVTP